MSEPTLGHGKICYLEIPAVNVEDSAAFYRKVFGWQTRKRGDGALAFDDGVGEVSGVWKVGRPVGSLGILIYIMVNDAVAACKLVKTHGGKIVQEIGGDAPEITARFMDPAGNVMGIFQERGVG